MPKVCTTPHMIILLHLLFSLYEACRLSQSVKVWCPRWREKPSSLVFFQLPTHSPMVIFLLFQQYIIRFYKIYPMAKIKSSYCPPASNKSSECCNKCLSRECSNCFNMNGLRCHTNEYRNIRFLRCADTRIFCLYRKCTLYQCNLPQYLEIVFSLYLS